MSNFIYNGISSDVLDVKVTSKTVYSSPKYDASMVSIPGRNGEFIIPNNRYPNVSVTYNCYVPAKSIDELAVKIRNIKKWLYTEPDRYHELSDSFDSFFYRKAVFNSKLDIKDEALKIGVFSIVFSCLPFKYSIEGEEEVEFDEEVTLNNPYPFVSKPYLKIYGSGNGSVFLSNSTGDHIWTISGINNYIECDSELMDFYKGSTLLNSNVVGDEFPELAPGDNTINFSGGISKIEIIPRWVCL